MFYVHNCVIENYMINLICVNRIKWNLVFGIRSLYRFRERFWFSYRYAIFFFAIVGIVNSKRASPVCMYCTGFIILLYKLWFAEHVRL